MGPGNLLAPVTSPERFLENVRNSPGAAGVWIPPGESYWALRCALGLEQAGVTESGL